MKRRARNNYVIPRATMMDKLQINIFLTFYHFFMQFLRPSLHTKASAT